MTFLIRKALQLLGGHQETSLSIPVESTEGSGWQGSEGYEFREWYSPDGLKKIVVTVTGGPEYGWISRKDIRLITLGPISGGVIMRVQAEIKPGSEVTEYNVYVDAITESADSLLISNIPYF